MKLTNYRIFFPRTLILMLSLAMAGPLLAQVYKTVDEDGNVVYTDQAPKDGSAPIELRPLSVIETPEYVRPAEKAPENDEAGDGKEMSLSYLRKNYADFAIIAPQAEETIWQPENTITVAWNTRYQLQTGMQVTVYVDGVAQTTSSEQIIALAALDRGEHTVTAELRDAQNRRIATAKPVTFFVRRPGLFNRPSPTPQGGN
ncbi:MAG: DUF4124 domain-containing protein [Xanthomonadales bacterium]|nr:DUF4124 domain-containing protein [Xanthomonadales bacterium]